MPGSMVYRLPVGDPAAPSMALFVQALRRAQAIADNRGYNWIAGFHGAPGWYCWHYQNSQRTRVQARLFLPWHRAYLWWLEQALQDLAGDEVALPWWDWTAVPDIPPAYAAPTLDGADNPLHASHARVPDANPPIDHVTQRTPGANPLGRLPRAEELISGDRGHPGVLEDGDFPSFSDRLEDLHDHVHEWVGGDMGRPATAAFDPVFFAHHCMIDRLWYLWQQTFGEQRIPRELLDLELMPFGKRVADVLNVQRLGYEYAVSATAIPVSGGHP